MQAMRALVNRFVSDPSGLSLSHILLATHNVVTNSIHPPWMQGRRMRYSVSDEVSDLEGSVFELPNIAANCFEPNFLQELHITPQVADSLGVSCEA